MGRCGGGGSRKHLWQVSGDEAASIIDGNKSSSFWTDGAGGGVKDGGGREYKCGYECGRSRAVALVPGGDAPRGTESIKGELRRLSLSGGRAIKRCRVAPTRQTGTGTGTGGVWLFTR